MALLEDIVQAALAEFAEAGIRRTSIEDVARRLGVGRTTVYRQVGSKERLVELVIEAETRRGNEEFTRAFDGQQQVAESIEAAFAFAVTFVRGHPLFDVLLRREPDVLLPALTIHAAPFLDLYAGLIAEHLQALRDRGLIDPADLIHAASAFARLVLSFVLTPISPSGTDDPAIVGALAREFLLPLLRATDS